MNTLDLIDDLPQDNPTSEDMRTLADLLVLGDEVDSEVEARALKWFGECLSPDGRNGLFLAIGRSCRNDADFSTSLAAVRTFHDEACPEVAFSKVLDRGIAAIRKSGRPPEFLSIYVAAETMLSCAEHMPEPVLELAF